MEAEAWVILQKALLAADESFGQASSIREIVTPYGGVDLNLPDRRKDASDERLTDLLDQ